MFEASLKAKRIEKGQTIEGTIVAIGAEVAFVEVGGKGKGRSTRSARVMCAHISHQLPVRDAIPDSVGLGLAVPMRGSCQFERTQGGKPGGKKQSVSFGAFTRWTSRLRLTVTLQTIRRLTDLGN